MYTGLLTDDKFLPLSMEAKGYFWALKFSIHTTGIEACIPHTVAALASLEVQCAKTAEVELAEAGWVKRDGAIVWIVNGLAFNPHLFSSDPKHRKFVTRHLQSLPAKNKLVNDFRVYYQEWFEVSPSEAPPEPLRVPSGAQQTTDNKQQSVVSKQKDVVVSPHTGVLEKFEEDQMLIMAVNEGQLQNPHLDYNTFEVLNPSSGKHRGVAKGMLQEYPFEFARDELRRIAKTRAPDGPSDAVHSLTYFHKPLEKAWKSLQERDRVASTPQPDRLESMHRAMKQGAA